MKDSGIHNRIPANPFASGEQSSSNLHSFGPGTGDVSQQTLVGNADPRVSLLNLSSVRLRIESVQRFLTESINRNDLIAKDQMDLVSIEIESAIHQIIVNGAALLACSRNQSFGVVSGDVSTLMGCESVSEEVDLKVSVSDCGVGNLKADDTGDVDLKAPVRCLKVESVIEELKDEVDGDDCEIIELDTVELLAEHIHFCEICGKGFKRDANLRMHMRAHGNQFKTMEALARPEKSLDSKLRASAARFSCPFLGCNRNKSHKKFRPLKSVICVKNHFKRSHCPKLFSCNRCNKKTFSVVADLRSHLKHCGEPKWRCTCGTSFSRKDKLFGHMALFEGHMPAITEENENATAMIEKDEDEEQAMKDTDLDDGFFNGLVEGFGSIDNYCLRDVFGSPSGFDTGMEDVFKL